MYVKLAPGYEEFGGAIDHGCRARGRSTQHEGGPVFLEHNPEAGVWYASTGVYIDNTSTIHVAGNQTYSSRVKHLALLSIARGVRQSRSLVDRDVEYE